MRPSNLMVDFRQAWRTLARAPGFTLAAVGILALGSGALLTVFGLVDEICYRPLPVPNPRQLEALVMRHPGGTAHQLSYPEFQDLRERQQGFRSIAAYSTLPIALGATGETVRAWGEQVSGSYFSTLGVQPAMGRMISAGDDRPEAPAVAVLSHRVWQRRFNADPGVIGKPVMLGGRPYQVIGVAEPAYRGMTRGMNAEFWITIAHGHPLGGGPDALARRNVRWLTVLGRRLPEVTPAAARAEVATVGEAIQRGAGATGELKRWDLESGLAGDDSLVARSRPYALVLLAVAAVLMLVACSNVSGLLVARGIARRREFAIRSALGASTGFLVRQSLVESALLAAAGAVAGLFLAQWGNDVLASFPGVTFMPVTLDRPDVTRVSLVAVALMFVAALAAGWFPALGATRSGLETTLRDRDAGGWTRGRRLSARGLLLVTQMALAVALLAGAGLFLRSAWNEHHIDPGYDARDRWAIAFDVGALPPGFERVSSFYERVLERAEAMPGVRSASLVQYLTPSPGGSTYDFADGELGIPGAGEIGFEVNGVGADYFRTLGIPLLRGREFTRAEALALRDPNVVIVNQALAERLWPGEDAVGQRIKAEGPRGAEFEVVGVVAGAKYRSLREAPRLCLYRAAPLRQSRDLTLVIAMAPSAPSPLPALRAAVAEVERDAASFGGRSLEQHVADQLQAPRMAAILLAVAGLTTLLLSGSGLFALISFAVAGRRREIGVRLALGARPRDVAHLVTLQGVRLAVVGGAIGMGVALLASRLVASLLFGVSPHDPAVYGAILMTLIMAVTLAVWVPARAAARLDPAAVLRSE